MLKLSKIYIKNIFVTQLVVLTFMFKIQELNIYFSFIHKLVVVILIKLNFFIKYLCLTINVAFMYKTGHTYINQFNITIYNKTYDMKDIDINI